MDILGHGFRKYCTGQLISTSEDHGWESLLVERWGHGRGTLNEVVPQATEVVVLVSGRLHVKRRGDGILQQGVAVPGTVWLCPAGVRETDVTLSDDIQESVHAYLPNNVLEQSLETFFDVDSKGACIKYLGGFQDPLIQQIVLTLRDQTRNAVNPISKSLVESLSLSLYAHLLTRYSNRSIGFANRQPRGGLGKRRMRRVNDYIDSNIGGDLSLQALADAANLSPFHFARAFRKTTGMSPHGYALAKKVEAAKLCLSQNEQSIVEVAFDLGFGSQSQFCRAFKRLAGLTPGEYRASVR